MWVRITPDGTDASAVKSGEMKLRFRVNQEAASKGKAADLAIALKTVQEDKAR
jgi:hypothetical protein